MITSAKFMPHDPGYNRAFILVFPESDFDCLSLCGIENFWAEKYGLKIVSRDVTQDDDYRDCVALFVPRRHWREFEEQFRNELAVRSQTWTSTPYWKKYRETVLIPKLRRRRIRWIAPRALVFILVALVFIAAWLWST